MKIAALIPAKGFTNAKQRLSSLLSAAERAVLAEVMLRDVLRVALAARGLDAAHDHRRLARQRRENRVAHADPEEQRIGPRRAGEQVDQRVEERDRHARAF